MDLREYEKQAHRAIKEVDRRIDRETFGPLIRFVPMLQWPAAIMVAIWAIATIPPDTWQAHWLDQALAIGAAAFYATIAYGLVGALAKMLLRRYH